MIESSVERSQAETASFRAQALGAVQQARAKTEAALEKGYLDENGKEVVPVIYERLERISNTGDEPTDVAELNGKFNYIDFVTGQTLIPLDYDAPDVTELLTDGQGRGIARANGRPARNAIGEAFQWRGSAW